MDVALTRAVNDHADLELYLFTFGVVLGRTDWANLKFLELRISSKGLNFRVVVEGRDDQVVFEGLSFTGKSS